MDETIHYEHKDAPETATKSGEFELAQPPNPVLARLIEEVRIEDSRGPNVYNRFHNRHNRSR